ncbi:MAG: hypothetical protein AAGA68_04940 [Pseudomonadota bacterium]
MHALRYNFSSLTALFAGVDPRRVALAAGALVLLLLLWRRVRDGLLMAVVLGAVLLAGPSDEEGPAPASLEEDIATLPAVILA